MLNIFPGVHIWHYKLLPILKRGRGIFEWRVLLIFHFKVEEIKVKIFTERYQMVFHATLFLLNLEHTI